MLLFSVDSIIQFYQLCFVVYAAAECVYFRIYYCKYGPMVTRVYTVNELVCYGVNFVVYTVIYRKLVGVNDTLSDRHLVV